MNVDYLIVAVVSALAIALHVVLYVLIRRWMDRDLALSLAGEEGPKRDYMLQRLAQARGEGVRRRDLPAWLQRQADAWSPPAVDGV